MGVLVKYCFILEGDEMAFKLEMEHKHILRLIGRDKKANGWTPVSEQLFKHLEPNMPKELCIFEKLEVGGRAKLTEEGERVLSAMAWL